MNPRALNIHNLTVAYGNKTVLRNISFSIPQGVLLAVAGPNGAGKSTLIKTIVNIIQPTAGTVEILGGAYHNQRKRIAYIPQRAAVDWDFPCTVFDAVLMGRYGHLGWFKRPTNQDHEKTFAALELLNILDLQHHPLNQLSCGQQQRVFLARALNQEADVYLMDEPLIGIDTITERVIIKLLKQLRDQGKTIVVVHHDMHTIYEYFDWLLLLNVEQITCGPLAAAYTQEHIMKTYRAFSSPQIKEIHAP